MRETFADDVFLAELVKRAGGRLDVVGGRDLVTNEQWATWDSVWRGWRKSAYGTVVRQPLAALGGGLALIGYGALPLAAALRLAAARRRPGALLAAAVVALQIDARPSSTASSACRPPGRSPRRSVGPPWASSSSTRCASTSPVGGPTGRGGGRQWHSAFAGT